MPVPPAQRRQSAIVLSASVLFMVVAFLTINAVAGSPIEWVWLIVVPLFVGALLAFWLWVRFTR